MALYGREGIASKRPVGFLGSLSLNFPAVYTLFACFCFRACLLLIHTILPASYILRERVFPGLVEMNSILTHGNKICPASNSTCMIFLMHFALLTYSWQIGSGAHDPQLSARWKEAAQQEVNLSNLKMKVRDTSISLDPEVQGRKVIFLRSQGNWHFWQKNTSTGLVLSPCKYLTQNLDVVPCSMAWEAFFNDLTKTWDWLFGLSLCCPSSV